MTQNKSKSNNERREIPREWFADDAVFLAPRLLGKIIRKGKCEGIIVETEAYGTDSASHAHKITPRSVPMRDTYGHWYIYFTYGMHHCVNVTTNKNGVGAILIRALEPTKGIPLMQKRRNIKDIPKLTNGPAKLCQAFDISIHENTTPIGGNFAIYDAPEIPTKDIIKTTRVGITKDKELPWRFYIKNNPFVSRI